jgi:hypothetical protein
VRNELIFHYAPANAQAFAIKNYCRGRVSVLSFGKRSSEVTFMSLFENYDEDYPGIANDDKNRLFETHTKAGRSVHDYIKVLVPVVVVVLILGGAVVYFTMPGFGDEVRAPSALDEAVKNHFLDNEKRAVEETSYFYCGDFYSARVGLEKRPDITARQLDAGNRRVTAVESPNGTWQISAVPIAANANLEPCAR